MNLLVIFKSIFNYPVFLYEFFFSDCTYTPKQLEGVAPQTPRILIWEGDSAAPLR